MVQIKNPNKDIIPKKSEKKIWKDIKENIDQYNILYKSDERIYIEKDTTKKYIIKIFYEKENIPTGMEYKVKRYRVTLIKEDKKISFIVTHSKLIKLLKKIEKNAIENFVDDII